MSGGRNYLAKKDASKRMFDGIRRQIEANENHFEKLAGRGIKAAVWDSFNVVGGPQYMSWLARNEPKAYATLLAKLMTAQENVTIEVGDDLQDLIEDLRNGC